MKHKKLKFRNNKGQTIMLDSRLTIGDLVRMGFSKPKLVPNSKPSPLRDNWWEHKP